MQKYPNLKIHESTDESAEPEPFQILSATEKKPKNPGKGRKKRTVTNSKKSASPIKEMEIEAELNNEEFAF